MEQVLDVRTHVYMRNAISPLHLHDRVSELPFSCTCAIEIREVRCRNSICAQCAVLVVCMCEVAILYQVRCVQ